ncbi:hypothetical protein ZWY2020_003700 [Hordeum vulgare]|nr:hypothetical protein ZWY2020_003700 [Hordeum vulgare]
MGRYHNTNLDTNKTTSASYYKPGASRARIRKLNKHTSQRKQQYLSTNIKLVAIRRFFVVVAITSSSGKNKKCAESPWAVEQNPTTLEWLVQSPPSFHTFGELPAVKETKNLS